MTFGKIAPRALASLFLGTSLLFTACKVSDPQAHDEEELITSVRLVLTPVEGGNADTVWFRDADGPGGLAPTAHDTIHVFAARAYAVEVSFLNESNASNVVDMTPEILDEANEHQVYYTVSEGSLLVEYEDEDENGLPLGLSAALTITSGNPRALTVTLKHQPGLKSANSTIETGETDVAVAFPLVMRLP